MKKIGFVCSLDLFGGRERRVGWGDLVCVECNWMIELMVVVALVRYEFTYGEYDFSSVGNWSYSRERV